MVVGLAACGGGEPSVSIDSPDDGATVTSPVTVTFSAHGFELAPTTSEKEGVGHVHWANDSCDTESGLEGGEAEVEVTLEPGDHTICITAFSSDHEELGAQDEITLHVTGPGGGVEPPPAGGSTIESVEHWKGTIDGDIKSGPDCAAAKNVGSFEFDVDENGQVAGSGEVSSTEYTCTTPQGTSTIPPGTVQFELTGTKEPDAFFLTFSDENLTMRLKYSGTTGSANLDQSVGEYIARSHLEIECTEGC